MLRRAGATGLAAAAVLAGCGGDETSGRRPDAPAAPPASHDASTTTKPVKSTKKSEAGTTAGRVGGARVPVQRAIGQRLVTGYRGAVPTATVLRAVREGRVGGVILFGDNVPTTGAARAAVRRLKAAAAAGHQPPLLVMVDQEGGDVKRLAGLPPDLSPAQMGGTAAPSATAHAQGRRTGRALRALGINVDLAPVADVPAAAGSFLGTRAFSRRPDHAAHGACGFAAGLRSARVAASLKHFPGLGRADGNTDLRPVRVGAGRTALEGDLAAYRRCGSTVPMVMVASASYPALGIDGPAVLSPRTYRMLAATGFKGVTITDAFDTPAIRARTRPALAALRAGVDLLLYGQDEAGAQQAYARLLQDARAGALADPALQSAARRVLTLKARLAR